MKDLIKITTNEDGKQLVSARELHEFLEIDQDFTSWIERMITYGYEENVDFTVTKISEGKVAKYEYVITIDMAKEISMIHRADKGELAKPYSKGTKRN